MNSDLCARVQRRQGLRSAGVRGTRKRGMGEETGCGERARNSCLTVWHFSGDEESGLYIYTFRLFIGIRGTFPPGLTVSGALKRRHIVILRNN